MGACAPGARALYGILPDAEQSSRGLRMAERLRTSHVVTFAFAAIVSKRRKIAHDHRIVAQIGTCGRAAPALQPTDGIIVRTVMRRGRCRRVATPAQTTR